MQQLNKVTASAPGKVNLSLGVAELRDDGYHELDNVFQAVNLRETITLTRAEKMKITIGAASGINISEVPLNESNLAYKAVARVANLAENPSNVHIHIHKEIPVAGGMAGGSADAAAALLAANALFGARLNRAQFIYHAAQLGADVPFALQGNTARGFSKGDQLVDVICRSSLNFVMVTDENGLSTPEVFNRFDQITKTDHRAFDPTKLLQALQSANPYEVAECMGNDLEAAALDLRPELSDILRLERTHPSVLRAMVSGSGPTVMLLTPSAEHAVELCAELTKRGRNVMQCNTPGISARIEDSE
ncbi:MAG: 4-(cytidine 5'-diphospho)-2-C-methyl-D-erythritol kinase [Micrococcaceae bacterium]